MTQYTLRDYLQEAGVLDPPTEAGLIIMPFKPFRHQVSGLAELLGFERAGLYDDAGTGKTLPLQAYASLFALYNNKVIVVMPPALLGQFQESWLKFMVDIEKYVTIRIFEGTVAKREKLWAGWDAGQWPDVLMMTYQMFSSLHRIKAKPDKKINRKDGGSYIRKGWAKDKQHKLKIKGYNVLVMDESQAVKNISAGVTKVTRRFVDNGDNNLVLSTGSPLGNTPEDCYAPIKLITPNVYETKAAFERNHIIRNIHSPFREIIDFINIEELHRNLFLQARRVTKEEVNPDLPPKLVSAVPVKLGQSHRKLYRQLLTSRILEFNGQMIDATNASKLRMVALRLISNPEHYVDDGVCIPNEMDVACDELISSIDPQQHKIIIFSNFRSTVARLKAKYASLNPASINSETRNLNVERLKFVNDDSCRLILLNPVSGGAGLDLQVSSYTIFYEPVTTPGQWIQAVARNHRTGQKADCVNIYLLNPLQTLASKQIKSLVDKDEVMQSVIRDPNKLLRELLGEDA